MKVQALNIFIRDNDTSFGNIAQFQMLGHKADAIQAGDFAQDRIQTNKTDAQGHDLEKDRGFGMHKIQQEIKAVNYHHKG